MTDNNEYSEHSPFVIGEDVIFMRIYVTGPALVARLVPGHSSLESATLNLGVWIDVLQAADFGRRVVDKILGPDRVPVREQVYFDRSCWPGSISAAWPAGEKPFKDAAAEALIKDDWHMYFTRIDDAGVRHYERIYEWLAEGPDWTVRISMVLNRMHAALRELHARMEEPGTQQSVRDWKNWDQYTQH